MDVMKGKVNGIVFCIFEIVVGILLLVNPTGFTFGIIRTAGIALIFLGIFEVVKYFKISTEEAALGQELVKGLVAILSGIFCTFKTKWFIVTFPVLTVIYGVAILLSAISKVQLTVDMIRQKKEKWFLAAINAVISIICACIILKSPFSSAAVLWIFTGVTLIIEGTFDVVTLFIGKTVAKG